MSEIGKHKTKVESKTERGNSVVCVTYHSTTVVEFNRTEGIVTLRTGGWESNTTKRRMNQASQEFNLGIRVFQEDFDWFVVLPNSDVRRFKDGMRIDIRRSEVIE